MKKRNCFRPRSLILAALAAALVMAVIPCYAAPTDSSEPAMSSSAMSPDSVEPAPQTSVWTDTSAYSFHTFGQKYTVLIRTSPQILPVVSSSDEAVVSAAKPQWSASANGYLCTLTSGKEGEAEVAFTAGDTKQSVAVNVVYQPVAIQRDTFSYTFRTVEQRYQMLFRTDGNVPLKVESSNQEIVTVSNPEWDAKSKAYYCTMQAGKKLGQAEVTATAGSTAVHIPVTADLQPVSVSMDTAAYRFYYIGQQYMILSHASTSAPVLIASSDASVVSISTRNRGSGIFLTTLTARKVGQADVTLCAGSSTAKMSADVKPEQLSISPSMSRYNFAKVGQSILLQFRTSHNLAPKIVTTNSRIASVQYLGWNAGAKAYQCRVRAAGSGSANITASLGQTSSSVRITVPQTDAMQARAQNYSSRTSYLMLVDTANHKVAVYHGRQGNWSQVKQMSCTNGAPSTPTVKGQFEVGSRGYYFDSGTVRCFYYTQFYGDYMFHSVLYQQTPSPSIVYDGRVGMALSHGCVRLKLENAKWINQNIPYQTKVVIY
jgi:lipoprotein-anchoring transpeptidase ErfK/SrfK